MSDKNVDVLNSVTKMLIDSQRGYLKAVEKTDATNPLRPEFERRSNDRQNLIREFQSKVETLGGKPETEGGALGALHRAFLDFSTWFQDNDEATLEAIDDGEELLGDQVEKKLKEEELDMQTRELLSKALGAAREGERFADARTD